MQIVLILSTLLLSYIIGSVPFGWVFVKLSSGRDIRKIESGRTGGTNAMRAAGFWAGLGTAVFDVLKAASTVWLARLIFPGNAWMEVFAPITAVLGHNYSIFLVEWDEHKRLKFRGGAGGAPTVGGAVGLWPLSFLITVPLGALVLFGVGYASLATMSVALAAVVVFAIRAIEGLSPWQYVIYGVIAEILLIIALLPNIRRLLNGTERVVGWRARKMRKNQ